MEHSTDSGMCGIREMSGPFLHFTTANFTPAGKVLMSVEEISRKEDYVLKAEEIFETADGFNSNKITGDVTDSQGCDVVDSVPSRIPPHNEDYEYHMAHPERGCFIIFNQENFDPHLNLDARTGTRTDAYNMFQAATHMGFQYIRTFHNCKKDDIIRYMKQVSQASHHTYDCFGCAILTHGGENDELYAKDTKFKLSECTEWFQADRCPSLAGKPKLFFIQACRGNKRDAGSRLNLITLSQPMSKVAVTIPNQADFLIARCTTPGHMAWRNRANGSWFVQSLHYCFTKYTKTLELMQIMTRINSRVAHFESQSKGGSDGYKQIPSISSQLTGEVYFFKTKVETNTRKMSDNPATIDVATPQAEETSCENHSSKARLSKTKSVRKWIRQSFRKRKATRT